MQDLDSLYNPDLAPDEQTACIEAFFHKEFWIKQGFSYEEYLDTDALIDYALNHFGISPRVRDMLVYWRNYGF